MNVNFTAHKKRSGMVFNCAALLLLECVLPLGETILAP